MMLITRIRLLVLALECATMLGVASPGLAGAPCLLRAEDEARCMQATCGGLHGTARHACRRRCRPANIRTLAWVESECLEDTSGMIRGRQVLRVRRGECGPTTVTEPVRVELQDPNPGVYPDNGFCKAYGDSRDGVLSASVGAFQRLGVSPDASRVVFEVTNEFAPYHWSPLPEQEGIFVVRADGSGLRHLGPPSREQSWRILVDLAVPLGGIIVPDTRIAFSPDGRRIAYTDKGPGADGGDAAQVVTLDLASGVRTQVTHLPAPQTPPLLLQVSGIRFVGDDTLLFFSAADADGHHPDGGFFRVNTDGSGLQALPTPALLPGKRVVPIFDVTGVRTDVLNVELPDVTPANPVPFWAPVTRDVFLVDGPRLLQLTEFGRADTFGYFVGVDGRRVFFHASANLQNRNPTESCQLFSIDRLGRDLRQITDFNRGGPHATTGCSLPPFGCFIAPVIQDPVSGTMVFISACDPFGTLSGGGQVFAMRPDGSGVRQLTTGGVVVEPDGTAVTTLPGPIAYSARLGF
jgi:hypothetical protein